MLPRLENSSYFAKFWYFGLNERQLELKGVLRYQKTSVFSIFNRPFNFKIVHFYGFLICQIKFQTTFFQNHVQMHALFILLHFDILAANPLQSIAAVIH